MTPNDIFRCCLSSTQKADINATDADSRRFGTLGVLRHGLRTRGTRFSFCQFKPEHGLNPELNDNYKRTFSA